MAIPQPGLVAVVATGGVAVTVIPGGVNGGFIQNPSDPADQGIGTAEPLYVNAVAAPGAGPGQGNGTTFVLYPGDRWDVIPGQVTPTQVNALTSGHKFSVTYW